MWETFLIGGIMEATDGTTKFPMDVWLMHKQAQLELAEVLAPIKKKLEEKEPGNRTAQATADRVAEVAAKQLSEQQRAAIPLQASTMDLRVVDITTAAQTSPPPAESQLDESSKQIASPLSDGQMEEDPKTLEELSPVQTLLPPLTPERKSSTPHAQSQLEQNSEQMASPLSDRQTEESDKQPAGKSKPPLTIQIPDEEASDEDGAPESPTPPLTVRRIGENPELNEFIKTYKPTLEKLKTETDEQKNTTNLQPKGFPNICCEAATATVLVIAALAMGIRHIQLDAENVYNHQ